MSQSLLLQVFIHTWTKYKISVYINRSQSLLLQVFIHTFGFQQRVGHLLMSQSLLLQVFIHTFLNFYLTCYKSSRNPFYYRSSFIPDEVLDKAFPLDVAIPSITGLHSYVAQGAGLQVKITSQSLLLQVFIHTEIHATNAGAFLGRNPFYYRSSFIHYKEMLDGAHAVMSQSLLLQVFIHTGTRRCIGWGLKVSQSLLLQVFIHTYQYVTMMRKTPASQSLLLQVFIHTFLLLL